MPATFNGNMGLALESSSEEFGAAGSTTWSMCGWMKRTGTHANTAYVVAQADGIGFSKRIGIYATATGRIGFRYTDGSGDINETDLGPMTQDEWIFFCIVRNGTNVSVWIGDPTATAASSTTIAAGVTASDIDGLFMARTLFAGTVGFVGSIAYVSCFDYALSTADRKALYNGNHPAREPAMYLLRRPTFYALLNDETATIHFQYNLTANGTGSPTFTDNSSEFAWAIDPIRFDESNILAMRGLLEWWNPQEAIPVDPDDYATTGLFRGTVARYDTETGVNPASSNLQRVGNGLFGPYSLKLGAGLYCPVDTATTALANATEATLLFWFRPWRVYTATSQMGFLGGVWGEQGGANGVRRLAGFISLRDAPNELGTLVPIPMLTANTHASVDGGITPGQSFNYDVSASGNYIAQGEDWQFMANVWKDGKCWSYLNGEFVGGWRNPWDPGYTKLYEAPGEPWRFGGVIVSGGTTWGNEARSDLAGSGAFSRALAPEEIRDLAQATGTNRLLMPRTSARVLRA